MAPSQNAGADDLEMNPLHPESLGPSDKTLQDQDHAHAHSAALDEDSGGSTISPTSSSPEKAERTDGKHEVLLEDQTNLLPAKQISSAFNAGRTSTWVGTAYILTSTVFQPVYGRFSDIFGRKQLLCSTLALFGIGSIAAALSRTIVQLIVFRAITGIGGGGIVTLSQIIIGDVVSLKDRGKYQGILGGMVAIANGVGPLIGGGVTSHTTWRWCFWINSILAGAALISCFLLLPLKGVHEEMLPKLRKIDYAGTVMILLSCLAILLPLSWGGSSFNWQSAAVIVPLILGCFFVGVLLLVEAKYATLPNIPLSMFRITTVTGVLIANFASGIAYFSALYFMPQYFQIVKGVTPIRSGILLLPLIVPQTICSFIAGFIASKTGEYKYQILNGYGIWTIGLGLLCTLNVTTSEAKIVVFLLLAGIGTGQTLQTTLVAAQASLPRKDMAVVTGLRNFVRLLGGAIALAVCQSIVNNTVSVHLKGQGFSLAMIRQITANPTEGVASASGDAKAIIQSAFALGVRNVFLFCAPCTGLAFFAVFFLIKRHNLQRDDDAELKARGKEWIRRRMGKKVSRTEEGVPQSSTQ
ncbi:MFS general substrate transporter [Sistotremastrum niveocremeum HHB9708]|uniref:MFS general substrate transporter n=1 Tax=Sistotremastrum niveocremeum HHB9708 TaxID=1314777 RepID=A0A165AAG6_9AGAM|nr:MFS general substrate transporter [Sistotremastrum niveocremeum HHB9708]